MNRIQTIFQDHGDEYVRLQGGVDEQTYKVIRAIQGCRTGYCGYHQYACPICGGGHVAASSCGNRHCPTCQNRRAAEWVYNQQLRLLPCEYFLLTFTLPEEPRGAALVYPREIYDALMDCAAEALRLLQADGRFVGCHTPGYLGVLHTWGRQMQYHPHVHFIVPGGGLSKDALLWMPCRGHFLVHVKPLGILFRDLMRAACDRAGLLPIIPAGVWQRNDWVVHCKHVGRGDRALKYLGAYVARIAISNARILDYDGREVTIKYQKVGSSKWRKMKLDATEFIRRYLLHILPKGFVKVRHYGFLHPNFRLNIQELTDLILMVLAPVGRLFKPRPPKPSAPLLCKHCGCKMKWLKFYPPVQAAAASPPAA